MTNEEGWLVGHSFQANGRNWLGVLAPLKDGHRLQEVKRFR